jgi:hypothetical protein
LFYSLDYSVSDKVKALIWANQYVDFTKLSESDVPGEFDLKLIPGAKGGQIKLTPAKHPKPVNTIGQWCSFFYVYMSVYTDKHPTQAKYMLIYEQQIRSLAFKGGDWLKYDERLRKLRAKTPIPWGKRHIDLWMECASAPAKVTQFGRQFAGRGKPFRPFRQSAPTRDRSFRPSTGNHPPGSCFQFHDTGKCTRRVCPFTHTCYREGCNLRHTISQCRQVGRPQGSAPPRGANHQSATPFGAKPKANPTK